MSKRKYSGSTPSSAPVPASAASHHHLPSQGAIRETIESVVIAFILAFLIRTFEAEAFVIPTGSMAPTLMGRHKDLTCPKCGCPYQVSASDEVTTEGVWLGPETEITEGTCPMCRFTANLGPNNPQHKTYPSYKGDRVLVGKFSYKFIQPRRWDVVVFKYPEEASVNFIKRLIGLPGETVRIVHGDIWIQSGDQPFQIARKPPDTLLAVLQPVFDNDYMPKIASYGWPARWQPEPAADAGTGAVWHSDDSTTFQTDGSSDAPVWMRYHHLLPSYQQWGMVVHDEMRVQPGEVKPQWITDFTAYNTGRRREAVSRDPAPDPSELGQEWVGDLAVACTVDSQSDSGTLIFELRKGGRRFQCRLDLATGQANCTISGSDMASFRPCALTNVRGKGRHDILFSNCDNELRLWVDGSLVAFDGAYQDLDNDRPDVADLSPVGVASAGAKATVSRLRVLRDLYYIAIRESSHARQMTDYEQPLPADANLTEFIRSHPPQRSVEFPLKADQYFMLGDNSARSKDGRLWDKEYWVSRELLIGKALYIYWPHSWDEIHTPWGDVPCPFFPNYHRMRLIR